MPDPTPPPVETDAGQKREFDLEQLRAENGRLREALRKASDRLSRAGMKRHGPDAVWLECTDGMEEIGVALNTLGPGDPTP